MKILKFSASWCGPCKSLSTTLANMSLPCALEEVDIDSADTRPQDYMIRGVPTMVMVDDHGTELGRLVGAQAESRITSWIESF